MGELTWTGNQWLSDLFDRLDDRLSDFADAMVDDARARAPIRKTTAGRRRGKASSFTPGEGKKTKSYQFGRVSLTGAEITAAAQRVGVPLFLSASIRRQKGKGELRIQERRPNRREKRSNYDVLVRRAYYKTTAGGDQVRNKLGNREAARTQRSRAKAEQAVLGEDARPGRLRRSITSENTTSGRVLRYTIRAGAPYARYVEFPTSKTRAQPFLLPALKNARSRFKPWMSGV